MAIDAAAHTSAFDEHTFGVTTPIPTFDVEAFARDSEIALPDVPDMPTLPPPPLHPHDTDASRSTALLRARLSECAARAELLAKTLRIGAVSREEAARVARLDLRTLESTAAAIDEELRAAVARFRALFEEMGGIAEEPCHEPKEILVVDPNPDTASTVALALELLGHAVRVATPADAATACRELKPAGVFVSTTAAEGGDATSVAWSRDAHVVLYGTRKGEPLGRASGADAWLCVDAPMDEVLSAIEAALDRLGW